MLKHIHLRQPAGGGGGASKTIFGLSWTNGETKLIDGTLNTNAGSQSWLDPWTGNHNFNMKAVKSAGEFYNLHQFKSDGGDAPFSLTMFQYGFTTATPYGYTMYKSNVATQWKTWNGFTPTNLLTTGVWGTGTDPSTPGANSGKITLTSGEVIRWWRSGDDTRIKITW